MLFFKNKAERRRRRNLKRIRKSDMFDGEWYRAQNPDVDFGKITPEEHYDSIGWREGRDPSPRFSTQLYQQEHPDAVSFGQNPILHYEWWRRETAKQARLRKCAQGRYVFNMWEKCEYYIQRFWGKMRYAATIRANRRARILVCLHLFYQEAWEQIAAYLANLSPYGFKLIVTYVEGQLDETTQASIRRAYPAAELRGYPNQGFDIGAFVDVLQGVNLQEYDIVFKLHAKGITRPFIFIYDQIFKRKDWYYNLFNGVLSGINVHRTVDKLLNGEKIGLVAAENLIVRDPRHKRYFTARIASELGVEHQDGYHFVAGTCFAMRAELLQYIQRLKLTIRDFEKTERGTFSLAHGVERLVCSCVEQQGYRMSGNKTAHPLYRRKIRKMQRTSAIRLLDDERFVLDYDFFYRALEMAKVTRYEVTEVRLGDIRREWKGRLIPLSECHPYKYLTGELAQYREYVQENALTHGFEMSETRFEQLRQSMDTQYDERRMPVLSQDNILMDGQHRCCLLLHKYGPEYAVKVLKIYA